MCEQARGGSGAEHPLDELSDGDSDWEDVERLQSEGSKDEKIMEDVQANICHGTIQPPKTRTPFLASNEEAFSLRYFRKSFKIRRLLLDMVSMIQSAMEDILTPRSFPLADEGVRKS
jgi:hypothetical protein